MAQEEEKQDNGTQERRNRDKIDAGDVLAAVSIIFCIFGAVWQVVDFVIRRAQQI